MTNKKAILQAFNQFGRLTDYDLEQVCGIDGNSVRPARQALERAGVRVVASVEWDKNAQSVLRKRFPNAEVFGDIQGVSGEQLRAAGFDPTDGIITGGFPCQDLSVAGKRAGLAGSRSGLFWEICRLLDETRTQTFILENVPGLLSSNNGRDMAVVIEALVERGYRIA